MKKNNYISKTKKRISRVFPFGIEGKDVLLFFIALIGTNWIIYFLK